MQRIVDVGDMMQRIVLPLLAAQMPLNLVAEQLGAPPWRQPIQSAGSWAAHLGWGLDSAIAAARLMLSLQPIGASIVVRTQLERWSANLEFNSSVERLESEDTTAWFNRLWSSPGVWSFTSQTPAVGDIFADLSELLHARGPLMPLVWLDIADINDAPSCEHVEQLDVIGQALTVSLSQVQRCLATALEDNGHIDLAAHAFSVPLVSPAESWLPNLAAFLWPMTPLHFQNPGVKTQLGATATAMREVVTAWNKNRIPDHPPQIWPVLCFGSHRFRAWATATDAYRKEKEILGDRFGESPIEDLTVDSVLAGEMAAMLALWLRDEPDLGSVADAFAVCSSALRSAEWLWLEDDPRAMGCLRCVIEQLARARTWRTKPHRAAKIEARTTSSPRDWIEGAGWKRLNLLNRALGEHAHGTTTANWELARKALVTLQPHADTDETAQMTGRTHALRAAVFLVSVECAAWVDRFGSPLGEAYRNVIRIDDVQADRAIEMLLDRAWAKRGTPLR